MGDLETPQQSVMRFPTSPLKDGNKVVDSMSAIKQRDKAFSILDSNMAELSKLYKECFLAMGRGAMLIYASSVIEGRFPNKNDYRKKEEILDVFDAPTSHAELKEMIDKYNYNNEGIMALITNCSKATFFVTVKLK